MTLIDAIQTIEDFIINAQGGETIKFIIADDWDETNNLPVVDVSLQKRDGIETFGDLNFETFEEALIALAKGLVDND